MQRPFADDTTIYMAISAGAVNLQYYFYQNPYNMVTTMMQKLKYIAHIQTYSLYKVISIHLSLVLYNCLVHSLKKGIVGWLQDSRRK